MKYFIKIDGEQHGPLSADQLRRLVAEKGLTISDRVRREDSDEWMTVGALEEFGEAAKPLPPLGNPMAWMSLGLGIASVLTFFVPVMLLQTPISNWVVVAGGSTFWGLIIMTIVFGHKALRKISVRGQGVARAGLWLGYVVVFLSLLLSVLFRPVSHITEKSPMAKAISNCRQIITILRLYADDHKGKYPDAAMPEARSSNAAFRLMFVEGEADNEMIFGCPSSQLGNPDGNIGNAPGFHEAVAPSENHWAMTKGITDSSDGSIPLVFENPTDATWPPKWSPNLAGTGKPGRTWSGGRVIIGFNDGSVSALPLESAKGEHVGLKPKEDGKPVFPDLDPKPTILQVESR